MSAKRLFVSIPLPETVTRLLADLDPQIRGVRWVDQAQMHLTLSFLGNVSLEGEDALKRNLRAFPWKPFFLPLVGLGKFPSRGSPNILWIGVGSGHPHLFQLHKRVQEAAITSGLEPDLRAFHPHVTIARCRDVSEASVLVFFKSHFEFDAGMIHVDAFGLYSSQLTQEGSIYTCELQCPSRS